VVIGTGGTVYYVTLRRSPFQSNVLAKLVDRMHIIIHALSLFAVV